MSSPSIRKLKRSIHEMMVSEGKFIASCQKIYTQIKNQLLQLDPKTPKDLFQVLNMIMGCANKLMDSSRLLLRKFNITIDPDTHQLTTEPTEQDIEAQYENISGFIAEWTEYINLKLKTTFAEWLSQMAAWKKLEAGKSEPYVAQINAALNCDFSIVFQRSPRHDLLSKALADAIEECIKDTDVQEDISHLPPAHIKCVELNIHCKSFARDINHHQGRVDHCLANKTAIPPFISIEVDDVIKKKSRGFVITGEHIQEIRGNNLFGIPTTINIPLKEASIVLRNNADATGQEYGTIILSAPGFEQKSPNEVTAQITDLYANMMQIHNHEYSLSQLLALDNGQTAVYTITAPMDQMISFSQTPVLADSLDQPRKIIIIKANITELKLKIPEVEDEKKQSKSRRRSSLGTSAQTNGQDNIIQIFNASVALGKPNDTVTTLRFPSSRDRNAIAEIITQLFSNSGPRALAPVATHRRRNSLFGGRSTVEETTSASASAPAPTPTNSTSTNLFQFAASPAAPTPVSLTSPTNASMAAAPSPSSTTSQILSSSSSSMADVSAAAPSIAPIKPLSLNTARSTATTSPTAADAQHEGYKPGRVRTPLAGLDPSQLQNALKRPAASQPGATKRRSKDNFTDHENQKVSLDQGAPQPRAAFSNVSSSAANGAMAQQLTTPSAGKAAPRFRSTAKTAPKAAVAAPTEGTEENAECNQQ